LNPGPVVSETSNLSSAETLQPVEAPTCVCGSPVKDKSERVYTGDGEKVAGCDCAKRVTVIADEVPAASKAEVKKSLKAKALDILCSACTGYVAKPKAGGYYPMEE
jgi:hypothetical protein